MVISKLIQSTSIKLFVLTVLGTSLFSFSSTALAAAPGNLYPPFDIGSQWNVCQGYDGGTHRNDPYHSRIAFDLTNSGCDNAAAQRIVRSPFTGTVSWYSPSSGSMCITALDNSKSVMLTHIDNTVSAGTAVDNYQQVGAIATPNNRENNGVAHLHLQAWSSIRCQGDENQIPFDSAFGTRICGAPNFPENGPRTFNNGTWGSTQFIGDSCSTTIPPSSPSVYRLYSPITQHHLYTTDVNELNVLRSGGNWNYEGNAYWVKSTGGCQADESVYRFYSQRLQVHLYTMDENERAVLSGYPPDAWAFEGTAYCASKSQITATKPIYRFYSEQLKSHLFTADENEKNVLSGYPTDVWRYEGIAYYAYQN